MELRFSEQEIGSMIEFALRNNGAPIKIANEASVSRVWIDSESQWIFVSLEWGDDQEADASPSTDEKPRVEAVCPACGDTFLQNTRRQKYCQNEDCKRKRVADRVRARRQEDRDE